MQEKKYHSGLRLRVLRELKGLKEKELAEAIDSDFDSILDWEESGVPKEQLNNILSFFEVDDTLFTTGVTNDLMLDKLAISELARSSLDEELNQRLQDYRPPQLDLSSLGLISVPKLIFNLEGLSKVDLSNNILCEISDDLYRLIDNGCEVNIRNNFFSLDIPQTYNAVVEDNDEKLVDAELPRNSFKLVQLKLENIGIYHDLKVDFNNDLTVIIGINGVGKTTILKALSLAILGPRDSIKHKSALLRGIGTPITVDSKIVLKAVIDDIEYVNEILLSHDSDTGRINIVGERFHQLYETSESLKKLILCLSEQRNNINGVPTDRIGLSKSPRVSDLLPFLGNDDQSCMSNFTSWWANLENSKVNNPDDENTIALCFEIFSRFMDENIQSAGLRKVKPNTELWIKYATGKSVPFNLASQGYQAVMGWVGFIIQRMIETNENFPLPLRQPAIVIIDEIDQLLSIKWQKSILGILREFFPNVQWIISTHSPMVLTDLEKNQVVQLHEHEGDIVATSNEVDLWMWQYGDIIRRYFEVTTTPPKYQEEVLVKKINSIRNLNDPTYASEITLLEEKLEKVKVSAAAADIFEEQLQSLKNREKQLVDLIESLKKRNG